MKDFTQKEARICFYAFLAISGMFLIDMTIITYYENKKHEEQIKFLMEENQASRTQHITEMFTPSQFACIIDKKLIDNSTIPDDVISIVSMVKCDQ